MIPVDVQNELGQADFAVVDLDLAPVAEHDQRGVDIRMDSVLDRLRQFIISKIRLAKIRALGFDQPEILLPEIEFVIRKPVLIEEFDAPSEIDGKIRPLPVAEY